MLEFYKGMNKDNIIRGMDTLESSVKWIGYRSVTINIRLYSDIFSSFTYNYHDKNLNKHIYI